MPEIDTPQDEVVEVDNGGLDRSPLSFFELIWDGSWKNLPDGSEEGTENERGEFARLFKEMYQGASTLREKFDAVVWAGHVDGSIPESIEPCRAPRTGDKGGPKPKAKTAAELLLKK